MSKIINTENVENAENVENETYGFKSLDYINDREYGYDFDIEKNELIELINKYDKTLYYKEIIKSLIYDFVYYENMIHSVSMLSFKPNEARHALIDYITKLKDYITKDEFIDILKTQYLFINDLYNENLNSYDFYILCKSINTINNEQIKFIINRIARLYTIIHPHCDETYCKDDCICGIQELEEDCTILFDGEITNRIDSLLYSYDYKIFNLEKHGDATFNLYTLIKELIDIFD